MLISRMNMMTEIFLLEFCFFFNDVAFVTTESDLRLLAEFDVTLDERFTMTSPMPIEEKIGHGYQLIGHRRSTNATDEHFLVRSRNFRVGRKSRTSTRIDRRESVGVLQWTVGRSNGLVHRKFSVRFGQSRRDAQLDSVLARQEIHQNR